MTTEHDADMSQLLSEEMSDRLKAFGFDPGIPVYEDARPRFDLGDVQRALFQSTYRSPITLPFFFGEGRDIELHMVVRWVQAYFEPYAPDLRMRRPLGCYNEPEWYLRGFLYKSGFDVNPEVVPMHVYLTTDGGDPKLHAALVQVVAAASEADPSTRLTWGTGIPAQ